MRCLVLVCLSACWNGNPAAASATTRPPTTRVAKPACDEVTFDAGDPACRDVCADAAPDDWPGCRPMPGDAVPPPPVVSNGRVLGRVVAINVLGGGTNRLTIVGGTSDGVTGAWGGDVADGTGNVVRGSSCTVVVVSANATGCDTRVPRTVVLSKGHVLLHPPPVTALPAPGGILARVVAVKSGSNGFVLTVAAGANQGVTMSWLGDLADQNRQLAAHGTVTLLRVGADVTEVETQAVGAVRDHPYVLLHP